MNQFSNSIINFLQHSNQFYWVHDLTGRILEVGDSIFRLIGYQSEELLGKNPYDFFHPDDREYIQTEGHEAALKGKPVTIEYRFRKADETYIWLRTQAFILNDLHGQAEKIFSISTPIDDVVKFRDKVTRQSEIFEHAGRMAKIGGWELDLAAGLLSWSKMTYQIHEVDESYQPSLTNALDFYPEKYRVLLEGHVKKAIEEGIPYDLVVQFETAKGRLIRVRAIGRPQLLYGKVVKLYGVFQDVNEEYERRQSLNDMVTQLTAQKRQLIDFNQIVSHNLRTPVGNLSMLLTLMDNENDHQEKDILLQNIYSISRSLTILLDELVDVVKLTTQPVDKNELVNVEEVIKSTLQLVQGDIKNLNGKVDNQLDWHVISYSKLYMESIFLNMFTNALKYADSSRAPIITVITQEVGNSKKLIFKDNGSGIDLKKNGHKLFKLHKTFHKDKPGKGLGLFMTKNQIESVGGSIEVESEINQGTTFTITLN